MYVSRSSRYLLVALLTAATGFIPPAAAQMPSAPAGSPGTASPGAADAAATPAAAPSDSSGAKSAEPSDDVLKLSAFLVTAVAAPGQTKMDSSVSVSTFSQAELEVSVPRSTGELFRNIPAIRVESSSGDGNLNLTSRGLPISAGGAKYVQLQEDGLPVLQFGDISFATADQWLRPDYGVANIESVIGGAASTLATNAPGGVINFISNTGKTAGGAFGVTEGLDYSLSRFDLGYGAPLGNDTYFYLSGFYRYGEGQKTADYNAFNGGQFKLNVTKEFASGSFVRIYFKELDDRVLSPLPVPMQISGSNADPTYGSLPGFDAHKGTLATPYLQTIVGTGYGTGTNTSTVSDGIHTTSTAIGAEVNLNLPGDWVLNDKFRTAINGGDFVDPYPASVGSAQTIANTIAGGAGATLKYANGPQAGQPINPTALNGNGLLADVHMFNSQLNNFNNTFNDLKLSKLFDFGAPGKLNLTAGLYSSTQNSDQSWEWNSYIEEVKGKDAALVNVYNAAGTLMTYNGLASYGTNEPGGWGNNQNVYSVTYTDEAPYGAVSYKFEGFTLEGSVRSDYGTARGSTSGGIQTAEDVNGAPNLPLAVANNVSIFNPNPTPVDYDWNFTSYSIGANYEFTHNLATYVRYSLGGSAGTMERVGGLVNANGNLDPGASPEATAKQWEAGVKYQSGHSAIPGRLELFATVFQAKTAETGYDFTLISKGLSPNYVADYKSTGFDVDLGYSLKGFNLRAAATYTHASIYANVDDPAEVGNTPQRVPDWVFQVTPSYTFGRFEVGGAVIGVTKSFSDNNGSSGGPIQPGYTYENIFVSYEPLSHLSFNLGVNNLFNTIGITEIDSGRSGPGNNAISARSIGGRSTSLSIKYTF